MLHRRPTGMLVSNRFLMEHVGFRWVSDGACRFQMGLQWSIQVSDGSPMGHVGFKWVTNEACPGLLSGMLASDGECQLPLGHVGLRWVSNQACPTQDQFQEGRGTVKSSPGLIQPTPGYNLSVVTQSSYISQQSFQGC